MSDAVTIEYSARPLHKKLKPELQAIATAMGLNANATVAVLQKSIQEHIRNHPEIADDPRFLPLLVHRTAPTPGKNSVDKAAEEALGTTTAGQVVSGANKTLLAQKVKTDPAPQFGKLSRKDVGGPRLDAGDDGSNGQESTSSASDSDDSPSSPEPEEKPKKNAKPVAVELPDAVRVNFYDENNGTAPPREVCVLTKEVPITALAAADGSIQYTTSLSKLLPVAFQNDSPIKERGGRIYRPNIRGEGGHHHLGRIDAILAGECRALTIGEVDSYTLRTSPGGGVFCDVFWDQPAPGQNNGDVSDVGNAIPPISTGLPVVTNTGDSIKPVPMFPLPENQRPKFTGSGSDIPLAIATDRALHNPTGKLAAPGVRDGFLVFLHSQFKAAIDGTPDFGRPWPRAKLAGMLLDRHLFEEKVLDLLTPWSRPIGGYLVPQGISAVRRRVFHLMSFQVNSLASDKLDIV
ncbi:hypothetical protein B0H19DRAFT_1382823 [Mycena capillaripes]|nr:hypothetical protein B0H19DRAFT_1382823 [Mycena capillaripes]